VRREVGRWQPDVDAAVEVVIADPARPGLGKPGVRALVAADASVIVLVSCDPASLARDTALLGAERYRPEGVEVLDLFPHTPHVETVTRFVRSSGGAVAGHDGGDPRTR
jgi:23S rRNA (uracil1939-C5)-methyltransferase